MLRRLTTAVLVFALGLCVGCGGDTKPTNPNNLEYGNEGPPKREGVKGEKKK